MTISGGVSLGENVSEGVSLQIDDHPLQGVNIRRRMIRIWPEAGQALPGDYRRSSCWSSREGSACGTVTTTPAARPSPDRALRIDGAPALARRSRDVRHYAGAKGPFIDGVVERAPRTRGRDRSGRRYPTPPPATGCGR
jgi:hypothetical protein